MNASWTDLAPADAARAVAAWVAGHEWPAYRASQILPRLWTRPVARWQDATDLPAALLAKLEGDAPIPRLALATREVSRDGTLKFLWRLHDGQAVESVWIPEGNRRTLCISSQAGCAFGCTFCATGRMGFGRHLTAGEIALQVREMLLDPSLGRPSNIVFMGMGEPLHNWDHVSTALSILNDPTGIGIGARHITVSTVGVIPGIQAFAQRPEQFGIALSLHSPFSAVRATMMPIERKWPLPEVLAALAAFPRRVTFEYVMIAGTNDRDEDADELARHARALGAHVNLLPLHPGGSPGLAPTAPDRIAAFAARLISQGIRATVRRSRGLDINAACGQLRVASDRDGIRTQEHAHIQ
ncbi:MAG: 23S rRNA (adenine(2503)-C(2))-methyltransferase RlmN [Gemmatimonadales bacterium]